MSLRNTVQVKQYTLKDGTVKNYDSHIIYFVKNNKNRRLKLTHTEEQKQQIIHLYLTMPNSSYTDIYKEVIKNYTFDINYNYVVKYINQYKKSVLLL